MKSYVVVNDDKARKSLVVVVVEVFVSLNIRITWCELSPMWGPLSLRRRVTSSMRFHVHIFGNRHLALLFEKSLSINQSINQSMAPSSPLRTTTC